MSHATNGTLVSAPNMHLSANTSTSARTVERTTELRVAKQSNGALEPCAKCSKYTQGLLWDEEDDTLSVTALWSITAAPVPTVPQDEFDNMAAVETINTHPHLFKITTPIKVGHFRELLSEHPNQPAVESVCRSLCSGFWPHAHTRRREYPIWDNSHRLIKSQTEWDFLEGQIDKEVAAG